MKFLIILAIFKIHLISAASIRCIYHGTVTTYTCDLIIENPDGFDNFTSIDGIHVFPLGNIAVRFINENYGISKNFPSIICETFPNLVAIRVSNIHVEFLDENSFYGCRNLHTINFSTNNIKTIDKNTFARNPLMDTIILSHNELTFNDSDVFNGTQQLTILGIDNNPLEDLPKDIFRPFLRLRNLQMFSCQLSILRPEWFETLLSLVTLQLYDNYISEIPENTFKNFLNLQTVQIQRNNLKILPSLAFPCRMQNLLTFNVQSNFIEAVDPEFFNRAQNLRSVNFNSNQCISKSFTNFNLNRDLYLSEFSDCHEEFERILGEKNACRFFNHPDFGYTCEFNNENYIEGDFDIYRVHINCLTDAEVTGVIFKSSNLTKIPQEVFTTFLNLKFLQASDVKLENVPKAECGENLKFIDFSHNSIRTLDSDAFSGCSNIQEIILDDNCIAKVQPCEETFVENLTTLKSLSMVGCTCVDEKFDLTRVKIEAVEEKMKKCFKMWFLL